MSNLLWHADYDIILPVGWEKVDRGGRLFVKYRRVGTLTIE
jgi:hypothetical protein